MKFKKIATIAMAGIMTASFLTGCGSNTESTNNGSDKVTVAMVSDVAGINDQSYNQSAWEGLERAKKELGIEIKYLESQQDSDYATNVETLADEEVDLIIGVGSKLADTIKDAAENYPDQKFAIIDETYDEIPSNVKSVLFESEQASYLVGLIAGKMSETKNVGFIGGLDIPVINTFKYGYMAGVKAADANCEIQAQYANSFNDQAKGKAITNQMISKGADVVFTAAGDVGTGSMEAIKEANKYGIGVDRDQSDLAPQNILTSAIKRVDVGMYETVKELVEGKFQGGTSTTYGLEQNGIGIADTTSNLVPQDVLDFVNEKIEELKAGKISVPKTEEEYNEFIKSL
nr:BMP family ABC transporter substrate-binding protein [uncultured Terrisporobacter sp.]